MEDALPYPVGTLPPGDKMNEIVVPGILAVAVVGRRGAEAGVEHDDIIVNIRFLRVYILIINKPGSSPSLFPV